MRGTGTVSGFHSLIMNFMIFNENGVESDWKNHEDIDTQPNVGYIPHKNH